MKNAYSQIQDSTQGDDVPLAVQSGAPVDTALATPTAAPGVPVVRQYNCCGHPILADDVRSIIKDVLKFVFMFIFTYVLIRQGMFFRLLS
jgi:hypothetical protein